MFKTNNFRYLIISDSNYRQFTGTAPQSRATGYKGWQRPDVPHAFRGSRPVGATIPRDEWPDRIQAGQGKFLSDLIKQKGIKAKDQNGLGYCFPGDTLIRLADGSYKPIQEIKVLDAVVTAEGNTKTVTQVIAHRHEGKIFTLKITGHSHLRATGNHPILTQRGYVESQDLQKGDMVAFPKYAAQTVQWIATGNFISERFLIHEKTTTSSASVVGRKAGSWESIPVPDIIHLVPKVGRLMGLFLAEGHTSSGTVFWSYGKHEHDTLAAETVALLKECFGVHASIKIRTNRVAQVVLHGTRWAKLFEGLFRTGAGNKRMCAELLQGPVEFLREVLYGWLDGDRKRGTSAATISRELALNMFDIANVLGMQPRFEYYPEKFRRGVHHKAAYVVHWREDASQTSDRSDPFRDKNGTVVGGGGLVNCRWKTEQTETHMWRAVQDVTSEPFDGWVFNLEVEDDHSYIAEAIGVHNCWVYGSTRSVEVMRAVEGLPRLELSPESVGGPCTHWRNEGGYASEAFDQLEHYGACETSYMNAPHSLKPRLWKPGWQQNALAHEATDWYQIGTSFDEVITCLLNRIPVAAGLDWWDHLVCFLDPILLPDNSVGVLFMNSWGVDWPTPGANGLACLTEDLATPDGAAAPIVVTACEE